MSRIRAIMDRDFFKFMDQKIDLAKIDILFGFYYLEGTLPSFASYRAKATFPRREGVEILPPIIRGTRDPSVLCHLQGKSHLP